MNTERAANFSGQPHRVSALDACPLRGAALAMIRFFIVLFALAATLVFAPAQTLSAQTADRVVETAPETDAFQNEDDIERAFRAVKRDENYQFDLAEPIPRKPPSAFSKWLGRVIEAIFNVLGPILEIAFYLGIGVLILGAIYLVGRAIYETKFAKADVKKAEAPEIPLYQPAEAQARILLDEVDRLAAEGRYGEAVHTLLFRSIQDIDRNRPNVVRRSLTSREIGSLPVLTPEARNAFSTIAGVSELAHFGGVSVNKAGFETARKAYADLTGQTPSARRSRR